MIHRDASPALDHSSTIALEQNGLFLCVTACGFRSLHHDKVQRLVSSIAWLDLSAVLRIRIRMYPAGPARRRLLSLAGPSTFSLARTDLPLTARGRVYYRGAVTSGFGEHRARTRELRSLCPTAFESKFS